MRRTLALLTALLAGAAVLAVAPAPTAIGEDPITLGVSPAAARTNATITVSGQGCYLADGITAADGLLLRLVDPAGRSAAAATIAVGRDGTWDGPFTVPDGLPAGEYVVQGTCIAPEYTGATVQGGTFTVTGPGTASAESTAETEAITNPRQIEPYPQYDGQSTCSPAGKPGMVAFRDMVMGTYSSTGSYGISRDCGIGGQSEHKEGRAWDWAVDAPDPQDAAIAQEVLDWLLATDRYGHRHAMARRLGMMYIIWNRRIFKLYQADRGWQPYSGSSPHTDHIHFSLTRAGGRGQTSFWSLDLPGPGGAQHCTQGITDVTADAWFCDALAWAVDGRVITGFQDGTFRPERVVNRAQATSWLWIQAGRPAASRTAAFDDVPANAWYNGALDWAAERGIIGAHTANEFRPNLQVTRALFSSMLWAYAGSPRPWSRNPFSDTAGKAAADAATWAESLGYVSGFPDGTFKPGQALNRAQASSWLFAARQFVDVPQRSWYSPGVDWARFRAVLGGNESHAFRPTGLVTRRELASALWWAMDRPASEVTAFVDVVNDLPARRAASWAVAGRLLRSADDPATAEIEFRPGRKVFRSDVVRALWAMTGRRPATTDHPWSDARESYDAALDWAFEHSIVGGYADGTFRGHTHFATRSQVAVFLRRLAATPGAWAGASSPPGTVLF